MFRVSERSEEVNTSYELQRNYYQRSIAVNAGPAELINNLFHTQPRRRSSTLSLAFTTELGRKLHA